MRRIVGVRYPGRVVRSSGRRLTRLFNWDVVVRLALVPVVGYVLAGAAIGASRRAAREAALAAMDAAAVFAR